MALRATPIVALASTIANAFTWSVTIGNVAAARDDPPNQVEFGATHASSGVVLVWDWCVPGVVFFFPAGSGKLLAGSIELFLANLKKSNRNLGLGPGFGSVFGVEVLWIWCGIGVDLVWCPNLGKTTKMS